MISAAFPPPRPFLLHCKDIAYGLIFLFPLLPPLSLLSITASPVTPVYCWWGESPSYVLSLLKSLLMDWKAYILFPNEAQWPVVLGGETSCLLPRGAVEHRPALSRAVPFSDSSYWEILGKWETRFQGSPFFPPFSLPDGGETLSSPRVNWSPLHLPRCGNGKETKAAGFVFFWSHSPRRALARVLRHAKGDPR